MPDSFIELDGEADNLVVTQSPLLLLQDLTTVLIGAVRDCKRRELRGVGLGAGKGTPPRTQDFEAQQSEAREAAQWCTTAPCTQPSACGSATHSHCHRPGCARTRTHLPSEGTLHKNPAAVSSHLKEGNRVKEQQAEKRRVVGRRKGVWIPLKSPGTNL